MPKHSSDILELPQEVFATRGEAGTDLTGLRGQRGPTAVWTPQRTPVLMLLQEVLADLFEVRDQAPQAQHHHSRQARAVVRQYKRDLQWLSSQEEQVPFSFGWVCLALGLEASAVRRHYLSGRPVFLPRRHMAGIKPDHIRLESIPHKAGAGKERALRRLQKDPLNGRRHEGNGTEPAPQKDEC